jgi:hypothetical protein
MHRLITWLVLAALALGTCGCGGSDQPKGDAEKKAAPAPGVPPEGP